MQSWRAVVLLLVLIGVSTGTCLGWVRHVEEVRKQRTNAVTAIATAGGHVIEEPRLSRWLNDVVAKAGVAPPARVEGIRWAWSRESRVDDTLMKHAAALRELKTLDLAFHADVTDVGLRRLTRLKELEFLNVSGTGVSDEGVSEFCKRVPRCMVRRSDLPNGGLRVDEAGLDVGDVVEGTRFERTITLRNPTANEVTVSGFKDL